jgi:DNA-binding beta-propeller fold protein YncE
MVGSPITVGSAPVAAAFSPDGSRVYVIGQDSGELSVLAATS